MVHRTPQGVDAVAREPLTRAEFLDMVAFWTKSGFTYVFDASMGNPDYNDAELRHILPAATAGDIAR